MKRNPNPPRMFCSFFFFLTFSLSHSPTHPQTHQHTQRERRERRERREKRDVCAIALIANKGAAIQGGVGWGKRKGIHTHTRMATDGCAALQWMHCAAMQRNGMEMGRDFAVVVSCFFLLFKERARLIGAAIAGCWLSKFTIRMQCNAMELK